MVMGIGPATLDKIITEACVTVGTSLPGDNTGDNTVPILAVALP